MSDQWYIDYGDRVEGPVGVGTLRTLAAAGTLRPSDRVSPDRRNWHAASGVAGLSFAQESSSGPTPDRSEAHTEDFIPAPIPGYDILGQLGAGGMGAVFLARQIHLDRVVALKTITSAVTAKGVARFEQEARTLARLAHPNVVQIFDLGRHEGRVFFTMELLDGEDLSHRTRRGRLDERTAWQIARQTAHALAHALAHGIIHRDVKPANLFLVPAPAGLGLPAGVPMVKVTDFGLALTRAADASDDRLTAAGAVLGTPAYMAPEQFASSDIDHRADVYALGATVFQTLAGHPPYTGLVWDIMARKREPAPRLGPPVSAASADLVAAMMARDPADRPQTYEELVARIDALTLPSGPVPPPAGFGGPIGPTGGPTISCELPPPPPTADEAVSPTKSAVPVEPPAAAGSRRRLWGGLVAAGVLAAGAGAVAWWRGDAKPPPPDAVAVQYAATGRQEALFAGNTIAGWTPAGGQPWALDRDDEQQPVLTGRGGVVRRFRPYPDYRVVVGLDLSRATAAEVVVAAEPGPPDTAPRWSVRVTRDGGAVFGRRSGDRGAFEPLGPPVPFPAAEELDGVRPYLEVRYERTADGLAAFFRGRPLGRLPADGPPTPPEVRLLAEGGLVRIDTVLVDELAAER